jgi:D-sedoheptulose 7-phosphate isomerase
MDPLTKLIEKYPELAVCAPEIQGGFETLRDCFAAGGKLLVCGNGGSAADAEHIVGELMKAYLLPRPLPPAARQALLAASPENGATLADHLQGALPAISLVSQSALISAFANDVDPVLIFAQQVFGYGKAGDALWAISTSGNARNVIAALAVGRALGLRTIGLTGPTGGAMIAFCDVAIRVPGDSTPAIQERHLPIYHTLCAMLEQAFFN